MARVKGSKSKASMELIDTSLSLLREIQPATVRGICYKLFTLGIIPSMEKKHTGKVSRQLVWAREEGIIPWEWIVDETRSAERAQSWNNPDEIINAAVRSYRRDYWQDQDEWVEVWSEKGTIRGVIAPVLNEYGVTFRVMHGFSSATSIHDVAMETIKADRPLTVLYVGDYDCSGMYMSEADIPSRLDRYEGDVRIERIALCSYDLDGLPSFPISDKKSDPRYQWYRQRYGEKLWELDAMDPNDLRARIERHIRSNIDIGVWEHARKIERVEVESMRDFLALWKKQAGADAR